MRHFLLLYCIFIHLSLPAISYAQGASDASTQLALARQFSLAKDYDKSIPLFEQLFARAPFDKSLYNEFMADLLAANNNTKALSIAQKMEQIRVGDLTVKADIAYVLEKSGKRKEAEAMWREIINAGALDAYQIKLLAEQMQKREQIDRAIALYELAREKNVNNLLYAPELILLYNAKGDKQKALMATLDLATTQQLKTEELKNNIALIVNKDLKLEKELTKALEKYMDDQPSQSILELWVWHTINTGDVAKTLQSVEALDRKNQANGYYVLQLAVMLFQNEKYEAALQALEQAHNLDNHRQHESEIFLYKANILKTTLPKTKPINKKEAAALQAHYENIFTKYPQYSTTTTYLDYAKVRAIYLGELDTAIQLLQNFIAQPKVRKDVKSLAKLDAADYYLIKGEQWESTLLYAQVDKDHKEDALGELAKFKNAQLSYYFGEFDWAQQQLKILKAASSDMIANDALHLSILITENTPMDSNFTPLKQFAQADLLLFQYKTKEAARLLDTILNENPTTPLADDILMAKAKIAIEEGRNEDAASLLETLYQNHKDDVLADDALYQLALLYQHQLNDAKKALKYLELLIEAYPGSSYIPTARQKYQLLNTQ